ncbi:hypothetical protein INT47_003736, partial [Mucor saturninus]
TQTMTDTTDLGELPAVSTDPFQVIVDDGLPVELFTKEEQHKQLLEEHSVIPRTNDFQPTQYKKGIPLRREVQHIYYSAPELYYALGVEPWVEKFVKKDMKKNREYEQYDPLKGNSLMVTEWIDCECDMHTYTHTHTDFFFLKTVIASNMESKITIQHVVDLRYPIRQIHQSPLCTKELVIFLVRTTSSIHVFKMKGEEIAIVDEIKFPQLSRIRPAVDYSMPVHAELSPFSEYNYVYVTNNGYMALMDGLNHRTQYDGKEPIPVGTAYKAKWRSCSFGIMQTSVYIVSPQSIKLYTFRKVAIVKKTLVESKEAIVAFKATGELYCYATEKSIVLMNVLKDTPLLTCFHHMTDGPLTELFLDHLDGDQWRLTAFSNVTQRFMLLFFDYDKKSIRSVKMKAKHQFTLSQIKFEEFYNYTSRIYSVGCSIFGNEPMTRIYRTFEDGSMRVQYLKLGDPITTSITAPTLVSTSAHFDKLLEDTARGMLPQKLYGMHATEVAVIRPQKFIAMLNEIEAGTEKIPDTKKREIAAGLADIKTSTPFRALIEDFDCHGLQDLMEFRDEMVLHEDIQVLRQVSVPGVSASSENERLNQAHEKLISLSRTCIRPEVVREKDGFQYVDATFESTTTTKALAELWTVGGTDTFPAIRPDHLLKPETFLACQGGDKRAHQEDDEEVQVIPPLATSLDIGNLQERPIEGAHFASTSTQPVPGVFGSRIKKPKSKKKVKKTAGFK